MSLLEAVKSSNIDRVREILDHAHATNDSTIVLAAIDADGSSSLHWAAWVRQPIMFSLLVSGGASINHHNRRGESVLEWAIRGGDLTIMSQLLSATNIDVHSVNTFGGSAAHIAAEEGHTEILAALYFKGAHMDATDARGKTPLMCAAHRNRPAAVQWLLRIGVDASLSDSEGATAMHYGAIGGSEFICTELLKQGLAQTLTRRAFKDQLTPQELAEKYSQTHCSNGLTRWKTRSQSLFKSALLSL